MAYETILLYRFCIYILLDPCKSSVIFSDTGRMPPKITQAVSNIAQYQRPILTIKTRIGVSSLLIYRVVSFEIVQQRSTCAFYSFQETHHGKKAVWFSRQAVGRQQFGRDCTKYMSERWI